MRSFSRGRELGEDALEPGHAYTGRDCAPVHVQLQRVARRGLAKLQGLARLVVPPALTPNFLACPLVQDLFLPAKPFVRHAVSATRDARRRRRRHVHERQRAPSALAGAALHCHSVSASIGAVPMVREQILGIDPATVVSTARGGHALGVAGEHAVAGIAHLAPLQAVPILYGPTRRERY